MSAESYKEKGNEEFKKGNYEKAIEYYTYACEIDPKNHIYYTNRSNCQAQLKKWDKSLKDAEKAIACKSDWEKGYYRKGLALFNLGRFQEAMDAYEQAIRLQPSNDDFKKQFDLAKKELYKGLSEAEVLKLDGNALAKAGKFDEAIKMYTKAIEKCGSDEKDTKAKSDLYANRAHCWVQLYEPTKVRADCDEAIKINPEHFKARIRRAQALESLEKYKAALDDFEYVARRDPGFTVAVQGITRCRTACKKLGIDVSSSGSTTEEAKSK